jgi:hypothetical protein
MMIVSVVQKPSMTMASRPKPQKTVLGSILVKAVYVAWTLCTINEKHKTELVFLSKDITKTKAIYRKKIPEFQTK